MLRVLECESVRVLERKKIPAFLPRRQGGRRNDKEGEDEIRNYPNKGNFF